MGGTQGAASTRLDVELVATFPLGNERDSHDEVSENRLAIYRREDGEICMKREYRGARDVAGQWWAADEFPIELEHAEAVARVLLGRASPAISCADIDTLEGEGHKSLGLGNVGFRIQCTIARELRMGRVALERRNVLLERRNAILADSAKTMKEAERAHTERLAALAAGAT